MNLEVVADSPALQVADDLPLLDAMLEDLGAADPIYQPTNYWSAYVEPIVAVLREGLRDFRRRGELATFGATDPVPEYTFRFSGTAGRANAQLQDALVANQPILTNGVRLLDIVENAYVRCLFAAAAAPHVATIDRLSVSRAGNPFGFRVLDQFLTFPTFGYYMRYAFVAAQIDFANIETVVELGSGGGRQAEVLSKLHPHLAVVQLDLAPHLYVAEQYLKTALPGRVVSYRENRERGSVQPEAGKVTMLGNFRIGDVEAAGRTLFWNAASFGEMEPTVVEHYAAAASAYSHWLFLHQCFTGKEQGQVGAGGVLTPVRMEHYEQFFGDHERVATERAHVGTGYLIEGSCEYEDTFWVRRRRLTSTAPAARVEAGLRGVPGVR
jgi:putative sugar O-methyltransferase